MCQTGQELANEVRSECLSQLQLSESSRTDLLESSGAEFRKTQAYRWNHRSLQRTHTVVSGSGAMSCCDISCKRSVAMRFSMAAHGQRNSKHVFRSSFTQCFGSGIKNKKTEQVACVTVKKTLQEFHRRLLMRLQLPHSVRENALMELHSRPSHRATARLRATAQNYVRPQDP